MLIVDHLLQVIDEYLERDGQLLELRDELLVDILLDVNIDGFAGRDDLGPEVQCAVHFERSKVIDLCVGDRLEPNQFVTHVQAFGSAPRSQREEQKNKRKQRIHRGMRGKTECRRDYIDIDQNSYLSLFNIMINHFADHI